VEGEQQILPSGRVVLNSRLAYSMSEILQMGGAAQFLPQQCSRCPDCLVRTWWKRQALRR
jgi:hypothetical protein